MSDARRIIEKYVNVETASLVTSDGGTPRDGNSITLFVNTQAVIRMHLLMADNVTPFVPEAGATWYFGIDDNYTDAHPDYVITNTAGFNDITDWADVDLATGKICFRVNTATLELKAALGTSASKSMVGEVWYAPPAGEPTILCQFQANIKNVATNSGGDGSELTYVTTTLITTVEGNRIRLLFPDLSTAQEWSK